MGNMKVLLEDCFELLDNYSMSIPHHKIIYYVEVYLTTRAAMSGETIQDADWLREQATSVLRHYIARREAIPYDKVVIYN